MPDGIDLKVRSRRPRRAKHPPLLRIRWLDRRTHSAKTFDRLVAEIEKDLGGRDQLSAIERALVEAFAGSAVTLYSLNTRLLLGEEIDLAQHAQTVSAMVRVATRLGLSRRLRNVTPSLAEYLAARPTEEPAP